MGMEINGNGNQWEWNGREWNGREWNGMRTMRCDVIDVLVCIPS